MPVVLFTSCFLFDTYLLYMMHCSYMFRNAEYVLALKDLMNLRGDANLEDYKEAFDRLDSDRSGYIETDEVKQLLDDVYEGKTPKYEVENFVQFFDENKDGRISWQEFEQGLGAAMSTQMEKEGPDAMRLQMLQGQMMMADEEEDDDDDEPILMDADISGTLYYYTTSSGLMIPMRQSLTISLFVCLFVRLL